VQHAGTSGMFAVTFGPLVWLVRGETMQSTISGLIADAQQMHCYLDLFML
jgi:hypothetical protein